MRRNRIDSFNTRRVYYDTRAERKVSGMTTTITNTNYCTSYDSGDSPICSRNLFIISILLSSPFIPFIETLRKYPPLAFISRETTDNYTFSNTKVSLQKHMRVWIPVFSIHRDPDIYSDPDKFDPERFSKEAEDARHPMHYLPFGHGPRNCIGTFITRLYFISIELLFYQMALTLSSFIYLISGARFAIYQTKIGLIKILQNYEVHVCEKTPIPYVLNPYAFIICPKGGLYLNIIKSKN